MPTLGKQSLHLVGAMLLLVSVINIMITIGHISSACLENSDFDSMISQQNENDVHTDKIVSTLRSRNKKLESENKSLRSRNKKLETDNSKNKKKASDKSKTEIQKADRKKKEENTNKKVDPKKKEENAEKKVDQKKKEESTNKNVANTITEDKIAKGLDLAATPAASHKNNTTPGFVRHDNVVIATKIHGIHQWSLLEQSLCLLHYAYNRKVLYDIIVFTTMPVPEENIQSLQAMLSPVKISVVVDNKGFHNEIADLPPAKLEAFQKYCNVTDTSNLEWYSDCSNNRLAYNWQAEFRGKRLWHRPELAEYKTMMWMDSDGFPTKPWEQDPVDYFIKNDGVILFDHFPQAKSSIIFQKRLADAFNKTLCRLNLSEETGSLVPEFGAPDKCGERSIPNIHGFFHITNLDFYRSPEVTKAYDIIWGDCFLCREPDDQLAVTAPAAFLAPERSWEMRSKGIHLDVFHNYMLDGIDQAKPAGFKKYWAQVGQHTLPEAAGVCKVENAG